MVPEIMPNGDYGFLFYGVAHRFAVSLAQDADWRDQPFGLIGSGSDLTGRLMSGNRRGGIGLTDGRATGLPMHWRYLMMAACGCSEVGEDLIVKMLLFPSREFGLLATSTVTAGRDSDDCCSPELYHRLYKVPLTEHCPIGPRNNWNFQADCRFSEWSFATDIGRAYHFSATLSQSAENINGYLESAYWNHIHG